MTFDMAHLKQLGPWDKLVPEAMAGFRTVDKAAPDDGAISKKDEEQTAIPVELTTQCPCCRGVHRKAPVMAGAAPAELAEIVFGATTLRSNAALTPR